MKRVVDWVRIHGVDLVLSCLSIGITSLVYSTLMQPTLTLLPALVHSVVIMMGTALCGFVCLYALDSMIGFFRAIPSFNALVINILSLKWAKHLLLFCRFVLVAGIYEYLDVPNIQGGALLLLCVFFFGLGLLTWYQYTREVKQSEMR